MKKILSLLEIITLIGMSTTSLVACDKSTHNENKENNKSKKTVSKYKQPPTSSNWKLINISSKKNLENELSNFNDKWYVVIFKPLDEQNYIVKFNSKWDVFTTGGNITFDHYYLYFDYIKSVYRWDGDGEPNTPIINSKTGQITDWKTINI